MTTMPGRTTVPAGEKKKNLYINEKDDDDSKWWYIYLGNYEVFDQKK